MSIPMRYAFNGFLWYSYFVAANVVLHLFIGKNLLFRGDWNTAAGSAANFSRLSSGVVGAVLIGFIIGTVVEARRKRRQDRADRS
jgi:hypothetical protein